jgi:hypothetical protein
MSADDLSVRQFDFGDISWHEGSTPQPIDSDPGTSLTGASERRRMRGRCPNEVSLRPDLRLRELCLPIIGVLLSPSRSRCAP